MDTMMEDSPPSPKRSFFGGLNGAQKTGLIALLVILLTLPVGLYLSQRETRLFPEAGPGPVTPPDPIGVPAILELTTLNKADAAVAPNTNFDVYVRLNTGEHQVTAADVNISYSRQFFTLVTVEQLDFLPAELTEATINESSDTAFVSFVYGSSADNPRSGEGEIAKLTFKSKNIIGSNYITFHEGTQVAGINNQNSVLGGTTPLQVTVQEPQDVTLNINLRLQGVYNNAPAKDVLVELEEQGGIAANKVVTFVSSASGTYSGTLTDLVPGTRDLYVTGPAHLRKKLGTINLVTGQNVFPPVNSTITPLVGGDLVRNNIVDIFDYNKLVEDFGPRMPQGGSIADLDLDNDVDIFDYNLIVESFGKAGE